MKRKDEFHFDFNEDAEPVEELHRMRAAMAKHFKTTQALWDYLWSTPPLEELIAEVKAEIAQKKKAAKAAKQAANPVQSRKAASKKKTPARRKTPKRPTLA